MDIVARIARVEDILIEMGYGNRIAAEGASELPTSVTAMVAALNAVDAAINPPSVPDELEIPGLTLAAEPVAAEPVAAEPVAEAKEPA